VRRCGHVAAAVAHQPSSSRSFAITYDYRCPYARIAHDHVVEGLRHGAAWDVTFVPFSLGQVYAGDGRPSVWEAPESDSGLLALQASIAVRDGQPDRFVEAHHALFEHRHAAAGNLRDRTVLGEVLGTVGVDVSAMWNEVDSGHPLATIEKEHMTLAHTHEVWGVPTFVVADRAVFVRLLHGAHGDRTTAVDTIERILDQIDWPLLNEFKHTSVPR
jgi:hypothetical protein